MEDTHEVSEKEPWSMYDDTMTHISCQDTLSGDEDAYTEHIIAEFLYHLNKRDKLVDAVKSTNPQKGYAT